VIVCSFGGETERKKTEKIRAAQRDALLYSEDSNSCHPAQPWSFTMEVRDRTSWLQPIL
jgi:hypothetical protein